MNPLPTIERLSKEALKKMLAGQVREPATCVIKFYSNTCPMCHALKEYYLQVASDYKAPTEEGEQENNPSLHFFAFNIADYPEAQSALDFSGVPTIIMIKTSKSRPKIRVLGDPEEPNKNTWYTTKQIKEFINKEL